MEVLSKYRVKYNYPLEEEREAVVRAKSVFEAIHLVAPIIDDLYKVEHIEASRIIEVPFKLVFDKSWRKNKH